MTWVLDPRRSGVPSMMDTGLGVVGEVLHAPVQGVPGDAARAIVGAYGFA
jgi:hypothetical protein